MKNCKKPTLRMAFGGAFGGVIPRGISVGGLRAMNDQEDALRRDATSRYGIDAQSATARMGDATSRYGIDAQSANARLGADTQRYGYDTSAASHRYGVDAQSATARMNDATSRLGISTQADTSRYGYDASKAASMYGADASKAASRYGADASMYNAGLGAQASNFAATTGANASMHNAGLGAQASNFAATTGANASMHNAGLAADASMYNAGLGAQASNFAATTGANASMHNAGLGAQASNFAATTGANASMHNAGLAAQANNYSADSNLLSNLWHMKNGGEVPVRIGLRNGGEIHASTGFAMGGFAERANGIQWLSPRDQMEFQAKMQAADDAHALQQAQLSAAGSGVYDRGIGAGAQSPGAQLAPQQQANTRWTWEQQDRNYAMQNRPLEMQERQRLTERRNMYYTALAGHLGAGGFGGKMAGALPVRPQPGYVGAQTPPALPQGNLRPLPAYSQHSFGLRNGGTLQTGMGGDVPGTGKGDKIPAKYEPGEFVVSNDMLAAEPGLRDHLRSLREQVLADKGMTVAEADAKAVGKCRGLRAVGGFDLAGMYPANLLDLSDVEAVAPRANTAAFDEEVTARAKELRAAREKAALEAREQALREISERSASTAAAETAQGTAKAAEAAKGSGGVLGRLKDVAGLPGRALDGIGDTVGSGLRSAGEFLAKHPKVVGALTSPALNVGAEAVFHHNELAPGTVPEDQWSKAPTIDKPRRDYSQADARRIDNATDIRNAAEAAMRANDLRSYTDAQSAALDAGKSAPALPKSLRDTGNIYKTVDDQGRVTYSGGNVKAGAKFVGGDGEEFTPRGSVEYAKPGERVGMTPDGKGVAFTRASEDKNQRAADIAQNAISMANAKAQAAEDEKVRAKEQERMDMIGEVRGLEQAALSGDNRAAALLPGARNLLSDQQKTDALERSEAAKNAAHIEGIKLQTQGTLDAARAKKLAERENEMIIAEALKKTDGNSEATVDLLAKAGRGDLSKILSERVTADNDRRTKDYENMIKEFERLGVTDAGTGQEIPGGAAMAAKLLLKRTGGKIIDADKRAEMMQDAILEARLLHGMQQKGRERNSSLRTWIAGDDNIPTDLPASSVPKALGWWGGVHTTGGIQAGDYEYGDHYLPATVGEDAIRHAKKLAKRKAGIE